MSRVALKLKAALKREFPKAEHINVQVGYDTGDIGDSVTLSGYVAKVVNGHSDYRKVATVYLRNFDGTLLPMQEAIDQVLTSLREQFNDTNHIS